MTVTQVSTMTMMQMIECGRPVGTPVPPDQASVIASSAADAASSIRASSSAADVVASSSADAPAVSDPVISTATPLVPPAGGAQSSAVESNSKTNPSPNPNA